MSILLAWNSYLVGGLTVLFLVVCVMMVLTVLIQRPQGGGLSGAFGSGAGSGQTAFGAKTGDALTIFTIIVFVSFLTLGIFLNFGYRPEAVEAGETTVLKTRVTNPDGTEIPLQSVPPPGNPAPAGAPGTPTSTDGGAAPGVDAAKPTPSPTPSETPSAPPSAPK